MSESFIDDTGFFTFDGRVPRGLEPDKKTEFEENFNESNIEALKGKSNVLTLKEAEDLSDEEVVKVFISKGGRNFWTNPDNYPEITIKTREEIASGELVVYREKSKNSDQLGRLWSIKNISQE